MAVSPGEDDGKRVRRNRPLADFSPAARQSANLFIAEHVAFTSRKRQRPVYRSY
jgi:hypothetical protein